MELISTAVVGQLTTALMTHVLEALAGHVRKSLASTEKEQALQRCLNNGMVALLSTASGATPDEQNLMVDIFHDFFDNPRVGVEIGELLRGHPLDIEDLEELFTAVGYDASTLPGVDFKEGMRAFEATFIVTAQQEAALQGTIQTAHLMTQTHLQRDLLLTMKDLVAFLRSTKPESIGIRGREILGVPEGTSEQVIYRLDPKERRSLKDEFGAQLLARDARTAIEKREWDSAEQLTREALNLDPDVLGVRSALGLAMADEVDTWFRREHSMHDVASELYEVHQHARMPQENQIIPVIEAILWLDEGCRFGDDPDGQASAALARMYGVTRRFDKMLYCLQRAIESNVELISHLRAWEYLVMLAHGCGNDSGRLQDLGKVLGMTLPASKSEVLQSVEEMDLTDQSIDAYGIVWYVMGQPSRWIAGPTPRFPSQVRVHARDDHGVREAHACYMIPVPLQPLKPHCIPEEPGAYRKLVDLIDELAGMFLFICMG